MGLRCGLREFCSSSRNMANRVGVIRDECFGVRWQLHMKERHN